MRYLIANWKMNLDVAQSVMLAKSLTSVDLCGCIVAVCPSFEALTAVRGDLNAEISLGAQDCSAHQSGAHTGEVSARSLAQIGCKFVILGHSERRANPISERSQLVYAKASAAIKNAIVPIICVGETLKQRQNRSYKQDLKRMLDQSLAQGCTPHNTIIAYEPVWSIGTGHVLDPAELDEVLDLLCASQFPVLYGGSVTPNNVAQFLRCRGLSGFLVGGASLNLTSFDALVRSMRSIIRQTT